MRWIHLPTWVLTVSFVAFVRVYLQTGRPWLAWGWHPWGGRFLDEVHDCRCGRCVPARGRPPDSLDVDLVNPSSSNSSVFGGQVLALQINVDSSAQNITGNGPTGALMLCNLGVTVNQVLADANTVLGGGALPSYVTSISDLNDLADNLNNAFDNYMDTGWEEANLCRS